MLGAAITMSFVIGVLVGFCAYAACKMGYKEISAALKEEQLHESRS